MRFIRYTDIGYWLPTSLRDADGDSAATREVFRCAFSDMEAYYAELCEIWEEELAPESKFASKKHITSMMRRIIGMGVATGGIWTLNIRALRHVLELRCSAAAEEEILGQIGAVMVASECNLFGDFAVTKEGYFVPKYHKV